MKSAFEPLMAGAVSYMVVGRETLPAKPILLPGSFNPLHQGHKGLLVAAEETTGRDGLFELSVENVDKPPLSRGEIERRLNLIGHACPVVLTRAPTFIEKARLFPGAWFALGYDTAIRLLSPKYHADIPSMLGEFRSLNIRFVVAGRLYRGKFEGLADMKVPPGFEDLFIPISEGLFREDISSTELRGKNDLSL